MFHISEFIFLGGFIVFIAAILVLDMLVIDKKAHEVSIREAGTWTAVWITLALAFSAFLWFKGDMVHGISSFADLKAVATAYAPHLKLNPSDFEASLQQYRHYMTISYISGYLIEKTLSVDNLFVMMMIFTAFGVGKNEYQHVLNWGILGAIVLRFVFIFLGAAIISRFDWVLLVFGGVLIYSGVKMFLDRNKKEEMDVQKNPIVRLLSKTGRIHTQFEGRPLLCAKGGTPDVHTALRNGARHRVQRPYLRLRQHPCRILRVARPLRGVLLQHLRHTRTACNVLPPGCHRRPLPLSEDGCVRVAALHRCEDAHT